MIHPGKTDPQYEKAIVTSIRLRMTRVLHHNILGKCNKPS